jgi:hypothetical protein
MVELFVRIVTRDKMSSRSTREKTIVTSKNDGRRGKVIENKGLLWKKWALSGNVYENTGT